MTPEQEETPPWIFHDRFPEYVSELELPEEESHEREWNKVGIPTVTKTGKKKTSNECDITIQAEMIYLDVDSRYKRIWANISFSGSAGYPETLLIGNKCQKDSIMTHLEKLSELGFISSREFLFQNRSLTKHFLFDLAPEDQSPDKTRSKILLAILLNAGKDGISSTKMPSAYFGESNRQSYIKRKLIESGDIVVVNKNNGRWRNKTVKQYYHKTFAPKDGEPFEKISNQRKTKRKPLEVSCECKLHDYIKRQRHRGCATSSLLTGFGEATNKKRAALEMLVNEGKIIKVTGVRKGVVKYYHRDFAPQQKETV